VSQTQPEDVNPAFGHEVDVLVVGAGSGGFTAALTAAERGLRTLVIEKAQWHGGSSVVSRSAMYAVSATW